MRCPCSRSCHSCANAVAELSLQPSPPSWSPCRHVAVALSWSRCHRALAGDRHAYTPRAVPRCLVGLVGRPWLRALLAESSELSLLSWGVVAARTRLAPYLSASRPPSALRPSWRRRRHHCWRRCRSPHRAGGGTSSSLASSIINANAASSTPVRQAAFVARGHTSALWCLPHPRAFAAEAAASLLVAAALAASGRRAALTLASTVRWAAIVLHRRRRRRRSPVALPS